MGVGEILNAMYVDMGLLVRRSPSAVSFVMRCLPAVHFRVDGKASWRMTPDDQLVERSGAIKPYTGERGEGGWPAFADELQRKAALPFCPLSKAERTGRLD